MLNVNGLYRHFKGGFYIVKEIAQLESSPDEDNKMVVYTSVETGKTWLRPLNQFFTDVSDRDDNVTGQTYRFELATDLRGIMSFMSTKEIVEELENRPDNPYDGLKTLEEDPDVWDVKFILGRFVEKSSLKGETVEEFVPITMNVWDTIEEAQRYRDIHYAHRPCVIARRVTRKVVEY